MPTPMTFIDFAQRFREASVAAKGLRWVGPYCTDGHGWRRATDYDHLGRWANVPYESMPSSLLATLRKRGQPPR